MVGLLLAAVLASPLPTNPPICAQYFPTTCSQALGEWLPQFATPDTFWDGATHITQRDNFSRATNNGSIVVFTVELQKAHVVYDKAHRIALYDTGCCSWSETVEAYASPPPKAVLDADLSALKTTRGVRLGMSRDAVTHIFGAAKAQAVPHHAGVSVLAYTTWPTRDKLSKTHSECGQFENLYFQNDRLISIQLGNGC